MQTTTEVAVAAEEPAPDDVTAARELWIDRGPAGRCIPLVGAGGSVLGAALRPAGTKNPIYVSVGHRVGLRTAVELVWSCCR